MMKKIVAKYLNKIVGINLDKPYKFEASQIVAVEENYFTISKTTDSDLHHFSYDNIVQIVENKHGIVTGNLLSHKEFPLVIKVGHIFEYTPV